MHVCFLLIIYLAYMQGLMFLGSRNRDIPMAMWEYMSPVKTHETCDWDCLSSICYPDFDPYPFHHENEHFMGFPINSNGEASPKPDVLRVSSCLAVFSGVLRIYTSKAILGASGFTTWLAETIQTMKLAKNRSLERLLNELSVPDHRK